MKTAPDVSYWVKAHKHKKELTLGISFITIFNKKKRRENKKNEFYDVCIACY